VPERSRPTLSPARRYARPPVSGARCFDAVVFDLDGTLVATDRFWLAAAESGARRALRELGLVRELPTSAGWLSLVGMPMEQGFRLLFPELTELQRRRVMTACIEEEERLLRRDGAPAMPGALEVVRELAGRGLALGVASNCTSSYLEHMLDGLGVRPFVTAALCRESPGIASKGDMLERLLERFGTRSVVMVGDRASDRDAAWENGIPHVHCAFGFAQGDEAVEAEARIGALAELPALLARRTAWIEEALALVDALERPGLRLGVTGAPGCGKTLFARDVARVLRARGRPAVALALCDLAPGPGPGAADPVEGAYALERLGHELLRPHEHGQAIELAVPALTGERRIEPGTTLVLEGPYLLGAKRRLSLDRLIQLEVPEAVCWRRLQGRDARFRGPGALDGARDLGFPLQRELERRFPPAKNADLVLQAGNPLGP